MINKSSSVSPHSKYMYFCVDLFLVVGKLQLPLQTLRPVLMYADDPSTLLVRPTLSPSYDGSQFVVVQSHAQAHRLTAANTLAYLNSTAVSSTDAVGTPARIKSLTARSTGMWILKCTTIKFLHNAHPLFRRKYWQRGDSDHTLRIEVLSYNPSPSLDQYLCLKPMGVVPRLYCNQLVYLVLFWLLSRKWHQILYNKIVSCMFIFVQLVHTISLQCYGYGETINRCCMLLLSHSLNIVLYPWTCSSERLSRLHIMCLRSERWMFCSVDFLEF